jgi:carbon storage regulator
VLVLARRAGEALQLGKDIRIDVLSIHGQQVKLGITAPPHIQILRDELLPFDPPLQDMASDDIEAAGFPRTLKKKLFG